MITNMPANHFVARASLASSVFDLFLDRNVSELRLNAPDSPDVFPDWRSTIAVIATQMTRWAMTTMFLIMVVNPFNLTPASLAHLFCFCKVFLRLVFLFMAISVTVQGVPKKRAFRSYPKP